MLRSFESYRRQFWPVIGALARRGFAVRPDEAQDLIQDFYVDEWERLDHRYDPDRGPFERYLFAAFYQFARRRIARDYSHKKRMLELSTIGNVSDEAPSLDEELDTETRAERMRKSLARLPSAQRKALAAYLAHGAANERDVAREMGITRYRLRESLTDALGRLASELDSLRPAGDLEHKVAVALWRDGMDARETAALLGLRVPEVQAIRKRLVHHLFSSLHTSTRQTSRRDNMFRVGSKINDGPLDLLRRALTTRDAELLQQLHKRAAEVVAALCEEDRDFSEMEVRVIAEDPQWLARVYEALGDEDVLGLDAEEAEIEAAICEIHEDQDREIAQAFQILTAYLPQAMVQWRKWFDNVPLIGDAASAELCRKWGELGAGDNLQGLTQFGITPATLFEATIGLQLLFERRMADSHAGLESVLSVEFGPHVSEREAGRKFVSVRREELLAQMRSSADCPPNAEEPVLRWTCLTAARRPRLFEGFKVLGASGAVMAVVHDPENRGSELLLRWSYEPAELREAAAAAFSG